MTKYTFTFEGENYVTTNIVGDDIYAKRPGRRGRPSRFTKQRLEAKGAVLVEVVEPVQEALPQDTPVLDTNEGVDPAPVQPKADEFPF